LEERRAMDFPELAPPPEKTLKAIHSMAQSARYGMNLEKKYADQEPTTERQKAISHALWRANELYRGCVTAAVAGSTVALETLARSLIEELINAQWSSLAEDNARTRRASSVVALHKYMRLNLQDGHGRILDTRTGQPVEKDVTDELLRVSKPTAETEPSLELKAKGCGLHMLYSTLYRALSITAHGNDHGSRTPLEERWEKIEALTSVAIALHTATLQSVKHFLADGEPISPSDLMRTLFPLQ
jgi:hypothetical protein